MAEKVKDRRVRKSQESFKEAFGEMILKVPYQKITITALAKIADLNRKTFYSHYDTMEDLLRDIEQDYVDQVQEKLDALDEDDLAGGILAFYEFLNTDDKVTKTLLYGSDYGDSFKRFVNDVMSRSFFEHFCTNEEYRDMLPGYFDAVTGIFLRWRKKSADEQDSCQSLRKRRQILFWAGFQLLQNSMRMRIPSIPQSSSLQHFSFHWRTQPRF